RLSSIKPEVTDSSSTNVANRTGNTESPFSNTSLGYTVQPNNNRTEEIIPSKDDIVKNTTIPVVDGNRTIEAESTTHRSLKTTTTTTAEPATVCPPQNGKFPVFLPHTENCSLYYVCDNGLPKLMGCPSPLHFNRQLNVCDYEWRAGCSKNGLKTTTTTEPANVCPPQNGKFPVFLHHTENCFLYYVCDNGLPKLMRCPAPLHFNRELNVCDYEWKAGCSMKGTTRWTLQQKII
ncbi:peritrophin-1-like, partial [Limulus polyphemus]|uniref:Peritrophin-1-like n=1 Tax=Limulus polyphemus TaxID=6850 RepID=A0ABM1T585_LIMPO